MKNMSNEMRLDLEMSVMKKLIQDILAAGYAIRINDGEEWTTNGPITNEYQLLKDLRSTDSDTVAFFHKVDDKWKKLGFILLVYGNMPYEVIADSSDDELTQSLLNGAEALQDAIAEDLT